MYLLDPSRGRSRRAKLRDKATSLYTDSAYYAGKVQRDLRNRTSGAIAGAKSKFSSEQEVADDKLEARIRTSLGRSTSHPRAIRVRAANGRVTLEGNILASELDTVLSTVKSVPGVSEVDNQLRAHEGAGGISDLQGSTEVRGSRSAFMRSNWSPATRLFASAVGGGLVLYGVRARGPIAKTTATVGAGLLTRGISNREWSSWTQLSSSGRAFGW